jgi:hypothetical protein
MNKECQHKYPMKVEYHCQIHNTLETANFIGCMGFDGLELALYNTPQGYTFSLETIKDIAEGKWNEEKWKKYGRANIIL